MDFTTGNITKEAINTLVRNWFEKGYYIKDVEVDCEIAHSDTAEFIVRVGDNVEQHLSVAQYKLCNNHRLDGYKLVTLKLLIDVDIVKRINTYNLLRSVMTRIANAFLKGMRFKCIYKAGEDLHNGICSPDYRSFAYCGPNVTNDISNNLSNVYSSRA